jgi:hypothetical protein
MVSQNRPYDDRKVWAALGEQGITIDNFVDVGIDIVYSNGDDERAGATVHATFVWTAAAKSVSAALDASESISDDEVVRAGLDAAALAPRMSAE